MQTKIHASQPSARVAPALADYSRCVAVLLTVYLAGQDPASRYSARRSTPISAVSHRSSCRRQRDDARRLDLAARARADVDVILDITADVRLNLRPIACRDGSTILPLTRRPGGIQAYKFVVPTGNDDEQPDLHTHEGYDWVYVLNGTLRLVLGEHDLTLAPGQAAEFDTRTPHWFGTTSSGPVEFLSLVGRQGERAHVRAAPKPATTK